MSGDWENDPELKALRDELIDSFAGRRQELDRQIAALSRSLADGDEAAAQSAMLGIHVVAHKLAGAASSYALVKLGAIAEALDDLLAFELTRKRPDELALLPARAGVLSKALAEAESKRGDSPEAWGSAPGKKLISDAGSLPSGASS